jgi:hypothetical protein
MKLPLVSNPPEVVKFIFHDLKPKLYEDASDTAWFDFYNYETHSITGIAHSFSIGSGDG